MTDGSAGHGGGLGKGHVGGQGTTTRLGALDAGFLDLEDAHTALHIAALAVFAGPAPNAHDLAQRLAARVGRIPRGRERLHRDPLGLRRARWEPDPHFDLYAHVRRTALPAPGGQRELLALAGRLLTARLDPERPLWEVWTVEGLVDDRWALFVKIHHAAVDGQAGMAMLEALLDEAPPVAGHRPRRTRPAARVNAAAAGLLSAPVRIARAPFALVQASAQASAWVAGQARHAARHPVRSAVAARDAGQGAMSLLRAVRPAPLTGLDGPLGAGRRFRVASVRLDEVAEIRGALGGTVNDVALTLASCALRMLLLARAEPPRYRSVRALVPVSTRRKGWPPAANMVSAMLVDLPVEFADAAVAHSAVVARLRTAKASHEQELLGDIERRATLLPGIVVSAATRSLLRSPHRIVDTVVTNVPGPGQTVHLLGRELHELYPYVPLADTVRVGFAVTSYAGRLFVGISCDRDATPDADILPTAVTTAFDELLLTARERSV